MAKLQQLSNVLQFALVICSVLLMFTLVQGSRGCGEYEFECHSNGKCIKTDLVCDKKKDCSDNSDEEDCGECSPPDWYQCLDGQSCIAVGFLCDGQENCSGGDDEDNCTEHVHVKCNKNEYTCQNKACIPLDMMCDGRKDCPDESDETVGCLHAEEQCKGFFCNNKRCLESHTWVCDGENDCGDGSDELGCVVNCDLENGKFLCKDNDTCISIEKVCDKTAQCADKSDEDGLCLSATKTCKNTECPKLSECHQLPDTGPTCVCPKGYTFDTVTKQCQDIDECQSYGICSQKCTNTEGSFQCSCIDKFTLKNDGKTCSVNGGEPLLLYTTQKSVVGIYLKSRHMYKIAQNLTQVIGVAYDGQNVYWTNIKHQLESIVRSREDGSEQEVLLTSGLEAPEDLALDWLTGNIYFSDNILKHISVCSVHGHYCKILITINVDQPRGIALHPQNGMMYWSDWGDFPMIARSLMDGSNVENFITNDIHWPNCITVDYPSDRLYWVDAKLSKIENIRLDGTDRQTVISDILKHPYGIAVFEDRLYWSDWETRSIHSSNKFTGKKHEVIAKDKRIYAVHIYHSAIQPKIDHPCQNRGCSHLCLLAGNRSVCACPENMILNTDQMKCIKVVKQQKLYIGMGNNLIEMEHSTFGRHQISKRYSLSVIIHNMEYNSVNGTIFIADNLRKKIVEYDLKTDQIVELINQNIGNVTAMSFDYLGENLYWSDSERHTVEVLSLRTGIRGIVRFFTGMDKPIGLVVMPENGKMFVALQALNNTHIDLLSLDGRGQQHHTFETKLGNQGIQLLWYSPLNDIFWMDREKGKLEFANFETLLRYPFRTRLDTPYSMTLIDDDILWSSRKFQEIYWTNHNNIGSIKKFAIENPKLNYNTGSINDMISLISSKSIITTYDHKCSHNNGDCSHICITKGKSTSSCLCPSGMVFKDAKNQTCIESWDCEFRCGSGECLTSSRLCNGHRECIDGSDEKDCDSADQIKKPKCKFNQFACHDGNQCIQISERCDQEVDCDDKSDEMDCEDVDHFTKCRSTQFTCNNGRCVDSTTVCDEFDDCGDNSDELNCLNSKAKELNPCAKNMFQCTVGTCIPKNWECDGEIECSDGSDEHDKCPPVRCDKGFIRCRLGQCIDVQFKCDGHNDCGDSSDEINCDQVKKRPIVCGDELNSYGDPLKFQCPSNLTICLDLAAKCNGTSECPRGEDEINCSGCSVYEFECENHSCIRKEFRCDKEKDCDDGSDELDCQNYNISTHSIFTQSCDDGMFDCRDGKCIDESRVCDGVPDCDKAVDEGQLCKSSCANNPCQQICTATPFGAVCSCRNGYRLDGQTKQCTDINECIESNPCSQICQNLDGSYRCSCYANFLLRTDKTSCKSIKGDHYLLFSSFDHVRMMSQTPITLKLMWTANDSQITGLDVNVHEKKAYFTTQDSTNLYEYNLVKEGFHILSDAGRKTKIAIDWITNNIYVISKSGRDAIKVCNFAKRKCARILQFGNRESVKTISVDAINRYLFYSVTHFSTFGIPKTTIYKAGLDGTKPEILLTDNSMYVTGLEADSNKKLLYFIDMHSKTLQSINYDDRTIKVQMIIKQSNAIKAPSGLSIFENVAFIINTGSAEAAKCQLYGNKICHGFNINVYNAEDIVIVGESRQGKQPNVCDGNKCSVMCVQAELGPKCICYDGQYIQADMKCPSLAATINNNYENSQLINDDYDENENNDEILLADSSGTSNTTILAVCFTIMGLILIGLCGYIFYRRRAENGNFLINMHFQNPLVRSGGEDNNNCSSPSVTAQMRPSSTMDEKSNKFQFYAPIQKLFKSDKSTKFFMETKQSKRNKSSTFGRSTNHNDESINDFDVSRELGNFDDDPTARLVL